MDVGQGDGVLWELPGGSIVVYDCGPPARSIEENRMVAALRGLGVKQGATLHALVASHGRLDHIGDCEEILQDYISSTSTRRGTTALTHRRATCASASS